MILDDEKSLKKVSDISNRTLSEIASQKYYPKHFVEVAQKALEERRAMEVGEEVEQKENRVVTIKTWTKKNPRLCLLAIITAILSGFAGFFVVVTSMLIALNPGQRWDRKRKWNYVAVVLLLINLILLIWAYYLIT